MEEIRQRHQFVVVGYVVMPEHVHFLFTEPERGNPSLVLVALKQDFAHRLLRELRATARAQANALWSTPVAVGHIWQRRFYDFVVFTEKKRVDKSMEAMGKYNEELGKAGVLLALDGLTPPATMSARVTFKGGKSKVTDGPFTEAKEVVGGYWIIQVKSREEALEWASRIPGKDNEMVEVRRMFDMTDFDPETQKYIQEKFGDDVAAEMRQ
jgi:hypothetical protein